MLVFMFSYYEGSHIYSLHLYLFIRQIDEATASSSSISDGAELNQIYIASWKGKERKSNNIRIENILLKDFILSFMSSL